MLAFPNPTGPVFTLTQELLNTGYAAAAASPRKRIIQPMHRSDHSVVQRMLNFMQPGTYIPPHLHPLPHATETIQVLHGAVGFVVFDADGCVLSHHLLSADGLGLIDIEAEVWHGFVVLEADTVVLEIKRGPYEPTRDKVFAAWAHKEGEAGTAAALHTWEQLFR